MRGKGQDMVIILCYVDDNYTLGKPKALDRFLEELKQRSDYLDKYLNV